MLIEMRRRHAHQIKVSTIISDYVCFRYYLQTAAPPLLISQFVLMPQGEGEHWADTMDTVTRPRVRVTNITLTSPILDLDRAAGLSSDSAIKQKFFLQRTSQEKNTYIRWYSNEIQRTAMWTGQPLSCYWTWRMAQTKSAKWAATTTDCEKPTQDAGPGRHGHCCLGGGGVTSNNRGDIIWL